MGLISTLMERMFEGGRLEKVVILATVGGHEGGHLGL